MGWVNLGRTDVGFQLGSNVLYLQLVQSTKEAGQLHALKMAVQNLGANHLRVQGEGLVVREPPERIWGGLRVQQIMEAVLKGLDSRRIGRWLLRSLVVGRG